MPPWRPISRSETPRRSHQNTAHHRLDRIGKLSGRDTRHLSDLIELVTAVNLLAGDSGRRAEVARWAGALDLGAPALAWSEVKLDSPLLVG
jgi:hypothetical protein